MERVDRNPDEFLSSLESGIRDDMVALDALIAQSMPGRRRDLWVGTFWGGTDQTIIGYGDLVQERPRRNAVEWFVVGLARQKRNYSLYVNAVEDGVYLGQRYAERLGKVKVGAASLGFTRPASIDLGVLAELLVDADRLCPPDRT